MKTEEDTLFEEIEYELTIYYMNTYTLRKLFLLYCGIFFSVIIGFSSISSCGTPNKYEYHYNSYNYNYSNKDADTRHSESIAFIKIYFLDEENNIVGAQGTAFAVDKNFLVTAGHICKVVKEDEILSIELARISSAGGFLLEENITKAIVFKVHPEKDLCVLRSDSHGFVPIELETNINSVYAGEQVYVVGCPSGIPFVKEFGTIISVNKEEKELVLNLKINKGNSGSPVIRNGKAIGLIYAYFNKEDRRHISFAVSSDFIHNYVFYSEPIITIGEAEIK